MLDDVNVKVDAEKNEGSNSQLAIYIASAIVGTKSLKNGCNAHTDA